VLIAQISVDELAAYWVDRFPDASQTLLGAARSSAPLPTAPLPAPVAASAVVAAPPEPLADMDA
jgi:hypothetical protein